MRQNRFFKVLVERMKTELFTRWMYYLKWDARIVSNIQFLLKVLISFLLVIKIIQIQPISLRSSFWISIYLSWKSLPWLGFIFLFLDSLQQCIILVTCLAHSTKRAGTSCPSDVPSSSKPKFLHLHMLIWLNVSYRIRLSHCTQLTFYFVH